MSVPKEAFAFVSYCQDDLDFMEALVVQLKILKNKGYLNYWSDKDLTAGLDWKETILQKLRNADIILLMVSSNFLASDFCWHIEMKEAIRRHDEGSAKVIPIYIRECKPDKTPIEKLQGVPKVDRPISTWRPRDGAWKLVAEELERAIDEWRGKSVAT